MIEIELVIKEVSIKTGVDKELVSAICKHVFLQTVEMMKNDTDTEDILFNKLFKFKLKKRYKEDKQREYSTK